VMFGPCASTSSWRRCARATAAPSSSATSRSPSCCARCTSTPTALPGRRAPVAAPRAAHGAVPGHAHAGDAGRAGPRAPRLLVFVFCAAHLGGWRAGGAAAWSCSACWCWRPSCPSALLGRAPGRGAQGAAPDGRAAERGLSCGLAAWLCPRWASRSRARDGARPLVAARVTAGRAVTEAVSQDLSMAPPPRVVGRGALLDRTMPRSTLPPCSSTT
jgi:hypothetical protein